MIRTAGIDVGSGAIKAVVMESDGAESRLLAQSVGRIRRREIKAVVDEVFERAVQDSGVKALDYIATTGEGEDISFATGHFYGMTTHARGARFLAPSTTTVLDIGALHARAVAMDGNGKVINYKMTSQCASGSGQFIENIARYLGVSLSEVGEISLKGVNPEKVRSICAVLAETDVINMVSRGISTPDILRGIHESMAGRFARLIRSVNASGALFISGGLASDIGLLGALKDALTPKRLEPELQILTHPLSIQAGAIGAALWGAYRHQKLKEQAWMSTSRSPEYVSVH
jgi:benzoyl-CoA reductase subunit D